jgi:hypothetical protein
MSRGVTVGLFAPLLFAAAALQATPPAVKLVTVSKADLCVTEGAIEELPGGRLSVTVPKMRAYLNAATPQEVAVRFTYLGSTRNEARLGSGELRRQFGLKLRAQDACNLVYAMWRIEPESKLVVSVKSNPGQHTSAECANRGYRNVKPVRSKPVPVLQVGATHELRAQMNGEQLEVSADSVLVWQGSVGSDAAALNGPVGMRSDNAKLELDFRAPQFSSRGPGCHTGPGESE